MTRVLAVLGRGLVDPGAAVLTVDDQALQRGDGAFETVLVITGPNGDSRAVNLDGHLARLGRGASALELPAVAEAAWQSLIDLVLGAWREPGEAALKLFHTRGTIDEDGVATATGLVALAPLAPAVVSQRAHGIGVVTLTSGRPHDVHAAAPWLLGGVKTISYAVNMAAGREAARRGADDLIFTSSDGWVLEAPTSSALWLVDGTLRTTPPGASGILAGTTQLALFAAAQDEGMKTAYEFARVADLLAAEAVWLVSSVRGATPVHTLDAQPMTQRPDLTDRFQQIVLAPATPSP